MSDYTPSMDEIKMWYSGAVGEYRCDTGMSEEEAEAAFDRALAAHDQALRDTIDAWAATIAHELTPGLRYQAGEQNAPTNAEVKAAALEFERHEQFRYGDDDQPRCECGFRLEEAPNGSPVPSLRMHQARAALVAAQEVSGR